MIRRFYSSVAVHRETADAWAVHLDSNRLNTPGRAALLLPTQALAEALAQEWRAQGETIRPDAMPLTRLANVAVERTPSNRAALALQLAQYGETDLLHHRAEEPPELALRQGLAWDPVLDWAEEALGLRLPVVAGVIAPVRDAARLAALAALEDDFTLTGLAHGAALFGSAFLAFALQRGRLDAAQAFALSRIDETFQAEQWGEDEEARERAGRLEAEALALGRFFALLGRVSKKWTPVLAPDAP